MNIEINRPAPFEKSDHMIWTDPHVQESLLAAHLDPRTDAASRRPEAIDRTVSWLDSGLARRSRILDLGCGPGLYAKRLARIGHRVTGIDLNRRSIAHATESAVRGTLDIAYIEGDYASALPAGPFDLIFLVYCDFGTLHAGERDRLLANCRAALGPGGKLVFDVFDERLSEEKAEGRSWEYRDGAGFWAPVEHLLLEETFHYPQEGAYCTQYNLLSGGKTAVFRVWEKYYSRDEIASVLLSAGFSSILFDDNFLGKSDFSPDCFVFVTAVR